MGGYSFGVYEKPCPNCGGEVRYSYFAGDHYDNPSFTIFCENAKKCGATFEREKWEEYSGNKFKETVRGGPRVR